MNRALPLPTSSGRASMPYRQIAILTLLACLSAPLAISQSLENIDKECVLACQTGLKNLPPMCDCEAVAIAVANGAGAPTNGPFPNGLPTGRDVIFEAKAQYDARMADVEDYYFVERYIVTMPTGFTMPGFFQLPSGEQTVPVAMPLLRFYMGELNTDGEKEFNEVPPAELAKMQSEASGQENPMADIDTSEIFGAFAAAMEGISGIAPGAGGPAGEILGGLSGMAAGSLREAQANVLGLENSEDGFGGDAVNDGIGMALEKEIILMAMRDNLPVYLGWYNSNQSLMPARKFALGRLVYSRTYGATLVAAYRPNFRWTERDRSDACLTPMCGADQDFVDKYLAGIREKKDEPQVARWHNAYVVQFDGSGGEREIFFQGRTLQLQSAEIWLVNTDHDAMLTGIANETVVPAYRRIEYREYDDDGLPLADRFLIETYSEGFESTGPALAPRTISQIMNMGTTEMKVKRLLSQLSVNAGPPSRAEVAAMIADTIESSLDDPTSSIPTSNASPPTQQQEPNSNPATGREPLIIPGQGTPAVRERTPIIPREND
ncbi:MAG: hypothetical protein O2795_18465 [Acidobacteria bacterium]|nr:hypothetical protein [Acidobacteriota bacterium]